eukprot:6465081-Amphidinium_carterae.1
MATLLARVCRLACKRDPDGPAAVQLATPSAPVQPTQAHDPGVGRKIKLNEVIDPRLDSEVVVFTNQQVQDAYNVYRYRLGAFPLAQEEVTAEQLSALSKIYNSDAAPYVDLGIFGAFGHRLLKRTKLLGARLTAEGQLVPVEIYGPKSFSDWRDSYAFFRSGSIMLDHLTPSRLDAYSDLIRRYVERYGNACWPIIYQADVRARMEETERLRRRGKTEAEAALSMGSPHAYSDRWPWEWVYQQLAESSSAFWKRELEEPSLLFITRTASMHTLVDDDARVEVLPSGTKRPAMDDLGQQRARPKRSPQNGSASKPTQMPRQHNLGPDGGFATNRKNIRLCVAYNRGECGHADSQNRCLANSSLVHQCSKCLSTSHPATSCPQSSTNGPPRKGRGKGSTGN